MARKFYQKKFTNSVFIFFLCRNYHKLNKMKKSIQLLSGLFLLGMTITTTAQISTSTGGASNVLPNTPSTNINVGIGTTNPFGKLDVVGGLPDGQIFASRDESNAKSLVFNFGSIKSPSSDVRMFRFYDWPISNFHAKSTFLFGIEDRSDFGRYRFWAETDGETGMWVSNKRQEVLFRVFEDGNDKVYVDLPKADSRIVIGGWGDYLPEHKFVVRGSSKIEGNILTDSNIGIGTSNFVDGSDTYRLSVKGKVRAEEVKVYTTWADYVFANDYKLQSLQEVETFINLKGHLRNVPSAKEVTENGLALGEMAKIQQEKIEELTLYLIQQNKEIEVLKTQMKTLLNAKK